jgi:hypothetical protein
MYGRGWCVGVVVEDGACPLPSNPTAVRGVSTQNFVAFNTRHTDIVGNWKLLEILSRYRTIEPF